MKISRIFISLILGLSLTVGLVGLLGGNLQIAYAASFTVDSRFDVADINLSDGVCAAGHGECTLRAAIQTANNNGQPDTITLGNDTYNLTIAGTDEQLAATGDLDITEALTITGLGPDQTIINANNIDRVFDMWNANTVVISGVTIMGGNVSSSSCGGIRIGNTDLTLINTVVTSNTTSSNDGGGVCVNTNSNLVLNGSQVVSNTANGSGGGVYLATSTSAFTQTGNSLVGHNVAGNRGGGIAVSHGSATLASGQVFSNSANSNGGGVYVINTDATLNVTGGQILSNTSTAGIGGGLYIYFGSATLSGGQIVGNEANSGGGLWVEDEVATFTQTGNSLIAYNTARYPSANGGGGIFINHGSAILSGGQILSNTGHDGGGVYVRYGNATLNGGQILSNTANDGGGVYLSSSATFTQTGDSIIAYNTATTNGGGLFIYGGTATLNNGQILDNKAIDGGGVYVEQTGATLNVNAGQIISNTAYSNGGALYAAGGTVAVSRTIISGNSADNGGGLFNFGGMLNLVNTTLSLNTARNGSGGGLSNDVNTTEMTFMTIVSNTATSGGDGVNIGGGVVQSHNTIVAYNGSANCNVGLTSNGYNMEDSNTCGLNDTGDQPNTDPLLGPLTDNGGNTLTHALLDGSPAIGQGICVAGITTDQRGVTRGSACDIGAFEVDAGGAVYLPIIIRN